MTIEATAREMDIILPEGAEVWVTMVENDGTEILHKIAVPLSEIKIVNPEVEQVN